MDAKIIKNAVLLSILWFLKVTSLPKLYHRISSKRGIPVKVCRRIENLCLKASKKSLDVKYWRRCVDLGVCPKFLRFQPPKVQQYRNTRNVYKQVVLNALHDAEHDERCAVGAYNAAKKPFFEKVSFLEKHSLYYLLNSEMKKQTERVLIVHNKKLHNLWVENRDKCPDCLVNLSSRQLSVEETDVLYRGLNHHVLPRKVNDDQVKASVERVINRCIYDEASEKCIGNNSTPRDKDMLLQSIASVAQSKITSDFRNDIKALHRSFTSTCKNICSSRINRAFHATLSRLAKDNSIKVCKFDKGTGVVVLDTEDYFSKLDIIVNDTTKFVKVETQGKKFHPCEKRQGTVKHAIKALKQHTTDEQLDILTPRGCGPGKLYGMCKVHKKDNPMRPVVSMIGTPEYQLAKYLDDIIKPNIPDKFMLYSTNDFLEKMNKFKIRPGDKCVSFDVCSLFTNVPLNETINIIADHIYSDQAQITPSFDKKLFINLLEIATAGMFIYKDQLYRQVDGVAMGNPLAPTIANFFLAHLENQIFLSSLPFYPSFYSRYVDDIFCIFRSNVECDDFLHLLNSLHSNIKFTVEKSSGSLPFLDVEIHLSDGKCETMVFRKETYTGVMLNFKAIAPLKWKAGLIQCMLNRARRICSTPKLFQKEVVTLKRLFSQNSYPAHFFDKEVSKFENKNVNPPPSAGEEQNYKYNLYIPFIGRPSIEFGKKLSARIAEHFGISVNVIYTTAKVGSFFRLKCVTPLPLLSRVVYKFTCLGDPNTMYIGLCNRFVIERVREHLAITRKQLTAVGKHIKGCIKCQQAKLSIHNFEIMKKCRSEFDTKIFEALYIKKFNPIINRQMFANRGASFTINIFD